MDLKSAQVFATRMNRLSDDIANHEPEASEHEALTPEERFYNLGNRIAALPHTEVLEDLDLHQVVDTVDFEEGEVHVSCDIKARYVYGAGDFKSRTLREVSVSWTSWGEGLTEETVGSREVNGRPHDPDDVARRLGLLEESAAVCESVLLTEESSAS